jgi:hypothetical protein
MIQMAKRKRTPTNSTDEQGEKKKQLVDQKSKAISVLFSMLSVHCPSSNEGM